MDQVCIRVRACGPTADRFCRELYRLPKSTELRQTFSVLLDPITNQIRPEHKDRLALRPEDDILHIQTFWLMPEYRNASGEYHDLALLCMDAFLDRLSEDFDGIILLEPAGSEDDIDGTKTPEEIETSLIAFYQKLGFQVWVQGPRGEPDSVSVMGMSTHHPRPNIYSIVNLRKDRPVRFRRTK